MILVADSSALIALSVCNSLELLDRIFSEVLVPKAVYDEIVKPDKPETISLQSYLKDKVCEVDMHEFIFWMPTPMQGRMKRCCFINKNRLTSF